MDHLDLSYEKLNDLLDECFWAERRYYNAAEDIQVTEYKRFLAHESVNRNRYCHKMIAKIEQEGYEASRLDIQKGNLNRDWLQVKAALVNPKESQLLEQCIEQDTVVIKKIQELLDDGWLPAHILEILVPMEFQIQQSHLDLEKLTLSLENDSDSDEDTEVKVRKLSQ